MDKIVEKRPLKFKKINHVKKMSKKLELWDLSELVLLILILVGLVVGPHIA